MKASKKLASFAHAPRIAQSTLVGTAISVVDLVLSPFRPEHARVIVPWVKDAAALRLLAPSTSSPFTIEKLLAWHTPSVSAFVALRNGAVLPVAYGELNRVSGTVDRFWLGHVLVRPERRRAGLGTRFVGALADEAFTVRQATKVELIVFPENEAAIRCYRRVGFRLRGSEVHRFQEDGAAERMLRLELTRRRFAALTSASTRQGEVGVPLELSGSTAIAAKTPSTKPSTICDTPL